MLTWKWAVRCLEGRPRSEAACVLRTAPSGEDLVLHLDERRTQVAGDDMVHTFCLLLH
jgi:hypothetical protein